jgi:hypothetical protein
MNYDLESAILASVDFIIFISKQTHLINGEGCEVTEEAQEG